MRKRTCVLLILLFLSLTAFGGVSNAYATGFTTKPNYLRVVTDDTPLFLDDLGTELLFYLPYSYYVKVLSIGESLTRVECSGEGLPAIDGYAPTDMLFQDNLSVTSPYPDVVIKTAFQTTLYKDITLTSPLQYVFAERELRFYGKVGGETPVYFVGYGDKLGYVAETDIYPFELPLHPNELTFLPTPPDSAEENPTPSNGGIMSFRIIIFVCLGAAGIIALLLLLKKKPNHQTAISYYDENDYE